MAYILVMCHVSLLQLLYLQSFTEIGIIVHRIYQQSLRSGPQTKIRICVFFFFPERNYFSVNNPFRTVWYCEKRENGKYFKIRIWKYIYK